MKEKNNSNLKRNIAIGTGVGAALGGGYALARGAMAPKFYHVVAENMKPFAQTKSDKLLDKVKHSMA